MNSKTKIVATIGPSCEDPQVVQQMIEAGVDVFRFNTKHNTPEWHLNMIETVRTVGAKTEKQVGVLIDLQGPEIRIQTPNGEPLTIAKDEEIVFEPVLDDSRKMIAIPEPEVFSALNEGDMILINDGFFEFVILEQSVNRLVAQAIGDYVVTDHKGVNLPGVYLDLPSLCEHDFVILDAIKDIPVDFVALSFVRDKDDINALRAEMAARGIDAQIVSKVEGKHAVDNIDDVVEMSDVVMVARGDLGIELPIEEIAYWQKLIIRKCRNAAKPVITATEMLQSMITNARPTRAEVSDVANAVFDGTDAVMLSGESATGAHPIKAVQMMNKIAYFNEGRNFVPKLRDDEIVNQSKAVTHAVMDIVRQHKDFEIDAVVIFTETGRTARDLSRFRPNLPVYAVTESEKTCNQLSISYGVVAHLMDLPEGDLIEIDSVVELLKYDHILHPGSRVVFVHGDHWKIPGLTNTITIKEIV